MAQLKYWDGLAWVDAVVGAQGPSGPTGPIGATGPLPTDYVSNAGGSTITVASGTTVPLTIQNNGTGNSFVVNDLASDTTPFVVDALGFVGIGSAVPAAPLHINQLGGIRLSDITNAFYFDISRDGADGLLQINGNQGNGYKWLNAGVERMRIDSAGNTTINAIAGGTTTTAAVGAGYMGLPQNTTTTGAYTVAAADAGKHIYSTATRTVTINSNANLALPIGTTITFVAAAGATVTIAITTDTLLLAGAGTTGSRTLAAHGMATAVKITATSWIISGNGLT